ncbi:polyprenyl diphosphate synthase [Longispora albida]|uniref:polyprenyl diphosphate synthase n=1 Tax=Longispora albida TaxID=203523 RepID=UPI00039F52EF|nr:polyprenyl diphosphate synthase [Longispora albida]
MTAQEQPPLVPHHLGVLVDGNRRWATRQGFADPHDGHRAGAGKVPEVIGWCAQAGIEVVAFYLLSARNLHRPAAELLPLLSIIEDLVTGLAGPHQPWRLRLARSFHLLPTGTARRLRTTAAEAADRQDRGPIVNVLIAYSGHDEITEAVRALLARQAAAGASISDIVRNLHVGGISRELTTAGQPAPGFLIRTGGEHRLSGFMPWQTAEAEFCFRPSHGPAFSYQDFTDTLAVYARRRRRFGQ